MKLMNTEDFIKSLKDLMTTLGQEITDYSVSFKADRKREESNGSLTFVFSIKNLKSKNAKDYKIALYIFENKKTVTSFIINGRSLNLLFENSTMDSPSVALHYLKDILLSEVEWIRKMDEEAAKKRASNPKQNRSQNKGSYNRDGNKGGYQKRNNYNNGKKPYRKNTISRTVMPGVTVKTTKHPYENSNRGGN